jgi:hypothetical protein
MCASSQGTWASTFREIPISSCKTWAAPDRSSAPTTFTTSPNRTGYQSERSSRQSIFTSFLNRRKLSSTGRDLPGLAVPTKPIRWSICAPIQVTERWQMSVRRKNRHAAATAAGTSGVYILKLLEETLGTKFNIVSGYQGVRDIDLAVERGELHCRAMTTAAYLAREPYHTWRKTGFARVLVQTGKNRDPQFSDVLTIYELMDEHKTAEKDRQLLTMILAATDFGRPIIAPPGVPAEKANMLRHSFHESYAGCRAVGRCEKAES